MFDNIPNREKTLGALTIGVALAAIIYNFSVEPLLRQWGALDHKIRDKENLLKKHSLVLFNKDIIEKSHSDYTEYFENEVLTPEEESAKALSAIEKLARGARVRITNIKPLAVKELENYNRYTFRVATESSIGQLSKFLYDMQVSKQLLKVERMVLRAKEREHSAIKAILHITKIAVF